MAFNISARSIRSPIPAIMLFVALTLLGIVSFYRLPITKFPNIDIPLISVTVTQQGAAPTELESQVTKRIEDSIAGITGVKHITSTIRDGASSSIVEFTLETNTERAINDVKDAVARVRAELPSAVEEPIVERIDIEGLPIVTYSIKASGKTPEELSWFVDNEVIRAIQTVKGVARASRIGGVEREIQVAIDPEKLAAMGITAAEVNDQLRANSIDLAGGKSEIAGVEQSIRTLGGVATIEELGDKTIVISDGRKLRLRDIATITDGIKEPSQFAMENGSDAVAVQIYRGKGQSDASVEAAVRAKFQELRAVYPDVGMSVVDNAVTYTYGNFKSAMHTLLEGAILAVIVVLIFLKDMRATLITAVALPLSIIPAFWAMSTLGFSLNLVSLLAITLATGILVDDAIVEIENIVRHMRMGKTPYQAALEAADEIGLAVIAISLTIVAIFAPVSFMGGVAGQYFRQFGLTVAVAVLFSLLVARLITPVLAAFFLRPHDVAEERDGELMTLYSDIVRWTLRHRFLTLIAGLGFFAASIASMGLLPSGFLPAEDQSRSLLSVELPPGSRIEDTIEATKRISARIQSLPEVENVFVSGGGVLGGGAEARKATLIINYVRKDSRKISQKQLEQKIAADLVQEPDMRLWFSNDNGARAFTMLVSGSNGQQVEKTAQALFQEMKNIDILGNVVSSASLARPEMRIVPRSDVAASLGITTEALSQTIRVATIGNLDAILTKMNIDDRQVPVRVQLDRGARAEKDVLSTLQVPSAKGPVPLSLVSDISFGQGPSIIDRYDRQRQVKLEGDLIGTDALGDALAQVYALPTAKNLPAGVVLKEFGDAEVMAEIFTSFALAMGAGLMMVYGLLVLLFRSFLLPITILFSLPLSIGGAILALLITHNSVSMPVVIGILMLMGVVTKNAIMLVDFAVERIADGMSREEALLDAGRKRSRPIIMTTIAMAAGMLPSALALGEGGEFRAPMAIAVIGGLIVSTFLSLLFVPSMFLVVDDMGRKIFRLFAPMIGPKK